MTGVAPVLPTGGGGGGGVFWVGVPEAEPPVGVSPGLSTMVLTGEKNPSLVSPSVGGIDNNKKGKDEGRGARGRKGEVT
jgi:hypothetical protein